MLFDEVLQEIGDGVVQHTVTLSMVVILFFEGFISTGIYFVLPQFACDIHLPWDQLTFAYVPYLLGAFTGSFIFGGISDVNGRRYTLTVCCTIAFVTCFVASTSSLLLLFEITNFILGLSLSGIHSSCRILNFEILPSKCRASRLMCLDIITIFGSTIAIVLAHLIINEPHSDISPMRQRGWRLLYVTGGMLGMIGAGLVSHTAVSPRQMLAHQRIVSTNIMLRKIYALNHSASEETYLNYGIEPFKYVENRRFRRHQCTDQILYSLKCILYYIWDTFKVPYLRKSLLLLFPFMCFFNGSTILSGLINERLNTPTLDCTTSAGRAVNETIYNNLSSSKAPPLFFNIVYFDIGSIAALIILTLVADKVRQNIIYAVTCSITGITTLVIALNILTPVASMIASILTVSCHRLASTTLKIIALESFPTKFRGTSFGILTMNGNYFAILVAFLGQSQCFITLSALGCIFLGATVLPLFVPINKNGIIDE